MRRTGIALLVVMALLTGCGGGDPDPSAAPPTEDPALQRVGEDCLAGDERKNIVKLPSPHGAVTGFEVGQGAVGVIMAHQSDGDLCQWKLFAQYLAEQGYRALAVNFDVMPFEDNVVTAVEAIRKEPGTRQVFLLGASMGGTAVLVAAAQVRPPVAGVVSLSAPEAHGGMNALTPMPQLAVPALFVAAEGDDRFARETRELYEAAKVRDKKLVILPGNRHGTAMLSDQLTAQIEKFIKDHTTA